MKSYLRLALVGGIVLLVSACSPQDNVRESKAGWVVIAAEECSIGGVGAPGGNCVYMGRDVNGDHVINGSDYCIVIDALEDQYPFSCVTACSYRPSACVNLRVVGEQVADRKPKA